MTIDFVENILTYCGNKGITEADFERSCGLSKGMVSKWKKGVRGLPSLTTLMKIQKATGISYTKWIKKGGVNAKQRA